MKKNSKRAIYSFLITILLIFGCGTFITFDPLFIMHTDSFGRILILIFSVFAYAMTITFPGWE